jgi:glycerophosphoryl diester phosphodiesterase
VTLVLAHRGSRLRAAENTISAFAQAVSEGADGVELDVQGTADDALVVLHDTTTGAGPVAGLPLAALRGGLPDLPVLDECLDVLAGHLVNIELKHQPPKFGGPGDDAGDRVVGLLSELLGHRATRGIADHVVVSSFDLRVVDRVVASAPEVETAFLCTFGLDPHTALAIAADHGHRGLHPDVRLLGGDVAVRLVEDAHARGLAVRPWTVNEAAEVARLGGLGVDAVISDDPIAARAARGSVRG